MIPPSAIPIVEARKRGKKPAELILISLIGRINETNYTVFARAGEAYDWRWVRGLMVCLYAEAKRPWRATLTAIAKERPAYLALWDASRYEGTQVSLLPRVEDIDKPRTLWRMELDFLPWLPTQNNQFAWGN